MVMGSVNDTTGLKVVLRFRFFKVCEDGRLEPKASISKVPPVEDPKTGVQSRNVLISTTPSISARIFMPKPHLRNKRLPLLYCVHGGGFCMDTAFSPMYCTYLNSIVGQAQVIAVSVDYLIYHESPIPACYEDSWAGLKWVSAHFGGNGPDPWLNKFADFRRVFVAGDSAGANISHFIVARAGVHRLPKGVTITGMILAHPFFGGTDHDDDRMWLYMCPTNCGPNDRRLKPKMEDLASLGCRRVLAFKAEKDHLGYVAEKYCEDL